MLKAAGSVFDLWDASVTSDWEFKWKKWLYSLPDVVMVPRSIPVMNLEIAAVELHGFADASKVGVCSAIYVVVRQGDVTSQGLLTSNSRIAKRDLTIPRLELVAYHMVANSLYNVRNALRRFPVTMLRGWSDSTVALYWIAGCPGDWKQFVNARAGKIKKMKDIIWRHCKTQDNPADIGSRGATELSPLWYKVVVFS